MLTTKRRTIGVERVRVPEPRARCCTCKKRNLHFPAPVAPQIDERRSRGSVRLTRWANARARRESSGIERVVRGMRRSSGTRAWTPFVLLCALVARANANVVDSDSMHTVFSTECNDYFDWQSLGLYDSWRQVGQRGKFTRLLACDESDKKSLAKSVSVVPDTHVHPNYRVHPETKDAYSAYNKPYSLYHWTTHANVTADFLIVLDADMIFRAPMTVELLGVKRGSPVSARYSYLKGTLPENHMGVKARVRNVEKTQQVGGFTVMHREDMTKLAPRWLYWTEQVRQDPDSWANTGDIYNDNGKLGPPWISEMYGYVFAAAELGVEFQVHDDFMLYPGYYPPIDDRFPVVLHYGLTFHVMDWAFAKYWFHSKAVECPMKLFQRPPPESALKSRGMKRRRDLTALTCAWGLYNATRNYAIEVCGEKDPKDEPKIVYKCLTREKTKVVECHQKGDDEDDVDDTFRGQRVEKCEDKNEACCGWAKSGECMKNPGYMEENCALSCDVCESARCASKCCPTNERDESRGEVVESKRQITAATVKNEDRVVNEKMEEEPVEEEPVEGRIEHEEERRETGRVATATIATHDLPDVADEILINDSLGNDERFEWYSSWRSVFAIAAVLIIIRVRLAQRRRAKRRSRNYVRVVHR